MLTNQESDIQCSVERMEMYLYMHLIYKHRKTSHPRRLSLQRMNGQKLHQVYRKCGELTVIAVDQETD